MPAFVLSQLQHMLASLLQARDLQVAADLGVKSTVHSSALYGRGVTFAQTQTRWFPPLC